MRKKVALAGLVCMLGLSGCSTKVSAELCDTPEPPIGQVEAKLNEQQRMNERASELAKERENSQESESASNLDDYKNSKSPLIEEREVYKQEEQERESAAEAWKEKEANEHAERAEELNKMLGESGEQEEGKFNSSGISLGLYHEIMAEYPENTVVSPYSIVDAVSLMYDAADGKVKQEMESVLGLNENQTSLFRAYDESGGPGFEVANKAFYDLERESRLNTSVLGTDNIQGIDIYGDGVEVVNQFISDKTHGKIVGPVKQLDDVILALVNCVYFNKGFSFDAEDIIWSDGNKYSGFWGETSCGWVKEPNKDIDLLKLDYNKENEEGAGDYSLYLVCDNVDSQEEKVNEYMKSLTAQEFKDLLDFSSGTATGYDSVEFNVPDFEVQLTTSAVGYLQNLGFQEAFNEGADSFKKLGDIHINDIIHAAWIKTTKDGTEAAAATAVLSFENSAVIDEGTDNIKYIKADGDFVFVIKDNANDAILFVGRVANNGALTPVG